VVLKSLTGPLRDGIRVNDDQATRPPGPECPQCNPEGAVNIVERGTRPLSLECANLLAQSQILSQERRPGEKEGPDGPGSERYEEEHEPKHDDQCVARFG
jgi:hypothetical protein